MKAAPLFFLILFSLSYAKEKKEIEVPINIGIGPAFFWIPGVMDRELHTGLKLDLYAVITPKILKENENKIPKQYKKYVNTEKEMHITPIWMMLIPEYLVISPGEQGSIYGGIWSGISITHGFVDNKIIELQAKLTLPTITYLYANEHIAGLGTMLRLENTIKFSEKFLTTLAYGHNFNISVPDFDSFLQAGVLSLVFHFRFINVKQKI